MCVKILKQRSVILFFLFIFLLFFLLMGKMLDRESERVVHQLYPRDENGVIQGLNSIVVSSEKQTRAFVLFHGFLESPDIFSDVIQDIKHEIHRDIYAPLLPFHGRDLETASRLDNQIVLDFMKSYIDNLAKKYQKVTVLGFSYSGLALIHLAQNNQLPHNVHLILYAPALFIKTNDTLSRLKTSLYGLWRHYCNYALLNCQFPYYESGDETSHAMFLQEKTLRYKVTPAISTLYNFDLLNRGGLEKIHVPFDLIIAVDDNRVDYEKIKVACDINKQYCHLYSFPSGKHVIHFGKQKKRFEALFIQWMAEKQE